MDAELAELTLTTDGTAFKRIQTTMILVRAAKAAATKRGTGGAFQARLFKEVRFFLYLVAEGPCTLLSCYLG